MRRIGFLRAGGGKGTPEERASMAFVRRRFGAGSLRVVRFEEFHAKQLRQFPGVLWWHYDASTQLPDAALQPDAIAGIARYVERGGTLLLSLLASGYVSTLGLESVPPNIVIKGTWEEDCWAPGYDDIRGFASCHGHPLFSGFDFGAYTWSPVRGMPYAAAFYEGHTAPAAGKIVAVERSYITVAERRRLVFEYRHGKGKVLTVGSHFFFAVPNLRFRAHLEKFAENCISYLTSHRSAGSGRSYWAVTPPSFSYRELHTSAKLKPAGPWNPSHSEEGIVRQPPTTNDFDLGGRRILIMGKELSGIDEVWVHPNRILRNISISFRTEGGEIIPTEATIGAAIVRPESLTRRHAVGAATVEETLFGDRTLPAGAMHFASDISIPLRVLISLRIDLRAMWPLPTSATGTLHYGWDPGLQAVVVSGHEGRACSIIGSGSAPVARAITPVEGDHREIAIDLEYLLPTDNRGLAVVFAGSNDGLKEAASVYRTMLAVPSRRLSLQAGHVQSVLRDSTVLESPDPLFNEYFRRALVAVEGFAVTVPGVGSSLMAGYATTAHGWDGGQSVSGRPGYAWFFGRDAVWTGLAMLACGMPQPVKEALEFLGSHQDMSGKILHEMTTGGFVHYDAADATPLYLILMGRYLAATGDRGFVRSQRARIRLAIEFCFSTDTDGDHLIENTGVGHGWVEGGALFPVHAELYLTACWREALVQTATLAVVLGDGALARRCAREATTVRTVIQKTFWDSKTLRYGFGKNADGSVRKDETIMPAVAILLGVTEPKDLTHTLDRFASDAFTADWGVRMVPRDSPHYNPGGYQSGTVWPLFTGWAALAEFLGGRPAQGFAHAMSTLLLSDRWSAGKIPEVLHGENLEPAGVCSHQAWSEGMALMPLVEGMMGFRPDARARRVRLAPYFPPHWERAEVRQLRVGNARLTMTMRRRANRTSFIFAADAQRALTIELRPWFPCGTTIHAIRQGNAVTLRTFHVSHPGDVPPITFPLRGELRVTYEHTGGIAPLPQAALDSSRSLRLIRESWTQGSYELTVEGKRGATAELELITESTPLSVENARITRAGGERITLAIDFDGTDRVQQKTVVLTADV